MKRASLLLLLLFLSLYSKAQENHIESILSGLPDITYEKIKEVDDYSVYMLKVRQPLDHSDTTKGFF